MRIENAPQDLFIRSQTLRTGTTKKKKKTEQVDHRIELCLGQRMERKKHKMNRNSPEEEESTYAERKKRKQQQPCQETTSHG